MSEHPFGLDNENEKRARLRNNSNGGCRVFECTLSILFVCLSPSKWNLNRVLMGSNKDSVAHREREAGVGLGAGEGDVTFAT